MVAWRRGYAYEAGNNQLVSTSAPGDDPDDPESHTDRYPYNERGAMTAMPHLPALVRDPQDQIRRADLDLASCVAWYAYDAAGQRVRKRVAKGGVQEERIYVGGYEVWRKRTGSGLREERQTLHVLDDQRRIALVETLTVTGGAVVAAPTPRLRYQLGDHLGTATLEVDEVGAVISYEEYHPYGTTSWWASNGSTDVSAKRYRYTGKEKDEETGLAYHGARYYAAWLGRWERVDPAGMVDGPNRYAYVKGNPVGGRDPTGMWRDEDLQNRSDARATPRVAANPNSSEVLAARGLLPVAPELLVVAFNGSASGASGSAVSNKLGGGDTFVQEVVVPEAAFRGTSLRAEVVSPGLFDTPAVNAAVSFVEEFKGKDTHVVLFGYSRGGDPAVQAAQELGDKGITVDRLYLVDPTEGVLGLLGRDDTIPENVVSAIVEFQGTDPVLKGAPAAAALKVDSAMTDLSKREFTNLGSTPLMAHGAMLDYGMVDIKSDFSTAAASWFNPGDTDLPPEEDFPIDPSGARFVP